MKSFGDNDENIKIDDITASVGTLFIDIL